MSALPYQLPIFRAEDAAGALLPFALLYTYAAGTTTPLATYQDAAGTIQNQNPTQCDASGLAIIFMATGVPYKFVLTDQFGAVQPKYPQDNLIGGATGPAGAPGSTIRDGAGAPSNLIGIDGDYYLNDSNGDVYKKTSGVYTIVANIKGTAGVGVGTAVTGFRFFPLSNAIMKIATSSNTPIMGGFGSYISFTPTNSTRLKVHFSASLSAPVVGGFTSAASALICYGTGVAPGSGGAIPGTATILRDPVTLDSVHPGPISGSGELVWDAILTGLTLGVPYWFDFALFNDSAVITTVYLNSPSYTIFEI
jgi:hypothetical protein